MAAAGSVTEGSGSRGSDRRSQGGRRLDSGYHPLTLYRRRRRDALDSRLNGLKGYTGRSGCRSEREPTLSVSNPKREEKKKKAAAFSTPKTKHGQHRKMPCHSPLRPRRRDKNTSFGIPHVVPLPFTIYRVPSPDKYDIIAESSNPRPLAVCS